jgi:hypothetical protein
VKSLNVTPFRRRASLSQLAGYSKRYKFMEDADALDAGISISSGQASRVK